MQAAALSPSVYGAQAWSRLSGRGDFWGSWRCRLPGWCGPLGAIELCARVEQIERRRDYRPAHCGPGCLVVAAPHPGSETFAAKRPSFSLAIGYEIGECDPVGSVEHLLTDRQLLEHVG